MKNLTNVLSALAFVFAVTTALAFMPPKSAVALIDVQAKTTNCPDAQVSDECTSTTTGNLCMYFGSEVVANNADCDTAPSLRDDPNN